MKGAGLGADPAMVPIVVVFLYMAMFDAIGTLIGIGEQAGFLKDGKLPRATQALMADASGTVVGAAVPETSGASEGEPPSRASSRPSISRRSSSVAPLPTRPWRSAGSRRPSPRG